jgi:hypothetical protein
MKLKGLILSHYHHLSFLEARKHTRAEQPPSPVQSFIKPQQQGHKGLEPQTQNNPRFIYLNAETWSSKATIPHQKQLHY